MRGALAAGAAETEFEDVPELALLVASDNWNGNYGVEAQATARWSMASTVMSSVWPKSCAAFATAPALS